MHKLKAAEMNDAELSDALLMEILEGHTTTEIRYEDLHKLLVNNFKVSDISQVVPSWLNHLGLFGCCLLTNYLKEHDYVARNAVPLGDPALQAIISGVADHLKSRLQSPTHSWKDLEMAKFLLEITRWHMGDGSELRFFPYTRALASVVEQASAQKE